MRMLTGLVLAMIGIPAASAGPEQQAQIDAGCRASTNWSAPACACIAAEAGAKLSDAQQGYLAATLNDQDAAGFAGELGAPELLEASMFMMKSGPACQ